MKCEGELINMTRAWDKEKFWVPDRNRTHDLPNTGWALYGSANDPRTANDPGPQMIPKLNHKWSRTGMTPILDRKWSRSKNMEWHGFISEEGENMFKNNELKNIFYHFAKKLSTVAVLFFEGYRSFSLSHNNRNNKSKTNQWKKLRSCDVRYRR